MTTEIAAVPTTTPAPTTSNTTAPVQPNASTILAGQQSQGQPAAQSDVWAAMGLDPDNLAMIKTKGYKTPNDLAKGYVEAQRLIGRNRVPLPGPDAKPEEIKAFQRSIGVPEKPEEYDLKKPEKGFYDDNTAGWYRKTAHEQGLTKKQASAMHEAYLGHMAVQEQALSQQRQIDNTNMMNDLQTEWGSAYEPNVEIAKRAVAKYFPGEDGKKMLTEIENGVGSAQLVKICHRIGKNLSEDNIEIGKSSYSKTPADAKQEIDRLYADPEFMKKFTDRNNPQHQWAKDQMSDLHKMQAGGR